MKLFERSAQVHPDFDVEIWHGDGSWPDVSATVAETEESFPVCSPTLFERRPRIKSTRRSEAPHCHQVLLARFCATNGRSAESTATHAASRYPRRRDTSTAHARNGAATFPFQSLSNVASGPIAVMPRTKLPPESKTGAQNALMPGMG